MHALGVNGVVVELFWGVVEAQQPRQYDWSTYRQLISLLRDEGFVVQVRTRLAPPGHSWAARPLLHPVDLVVDGGDECARPRAVSASSPHPS